MYENSLVSNPATNSENNLVLNRQQKDVLEKPEDSAVRLDRQENIQQNLVGSVIGENSTLGNLETLKKKHKEIEENVNRLLSSINQERELDGVLLEKDRLAFLFENSPSSLERCMYKPWPLYEKTPNNRTYRINKENCDPKCTSIRKNAATCNVSVPLSSSFDYNRTYEKDENTKLMVRFGEFSPLNPAFVNSSKPFTELGEYEERRKIFLEKKKREYQQYLINVKNAKEQEKIKEKARNKVKENYVSSDQEKTHSQGTYREVFSPERGLVEATDICFTRLQQEAYRKELDKQVSEKKRRQREQEEQEKQEYEKQQKEIIRRQKQLSNLMKEEYLSLKSPEAKLNEINIENVNTATTPENQRTPVAEEDITNDESNHTRTDNILEFVTSARLSSRSPIVRPGAETCAIDDLDTYKKLQRELYKKELAKQIEEKRKLEEERRLKELEEEKKIEKKLKEDEEKLRLEYEKEQAERAYRAVQRIQQEERLQEHLRRTQRETEERRKAEKLKVAPTTFTNVALYPTSHHSKGPIKNVSFAPKAYVYNIDSSDLQSGEEGRTKMREVRHRSDSSVIIEAPYVLAVKDPMHCNISNNCQVIESVPQNRPPSPPIPAVTTRNLMKPVPKQEESLIPSTVSMSKQAREKFLRDHKILSNLSEIRKKLLEKQLESYNS